MDNRIYPEIKTMTIGKLIREFNTIQNVDGRISIDESNNYHEQLETELNQRFEAVQKTFEAHEHDKAEYEKAKTK